MILLLLPHLRQSVDAFVKGLSNGGYLPVGERGVKGKTQGAIGIPLAETKVGKHVALMLRMG